VPTRRTFDLILLMGLLLTPAFGLLSMATNRWTAQEPGALGTAGAAFKVLGI
jgi:hypothetical protein